MKKRILSLLMVLVLCFSLVPAEALATETESAAPAAQEEVREDEPAPTPTPTPTAEPAPMEGSAPAEEPNAEASPAPTAPVEDGEEDDNTVIVIAAEDDKTAEDNKTGETDGIAPLTADDENGIEVQAAGENEAMVGGIEYPSLKELLEVDMVEEEITLLKSVTEDDLTVYGDTTINMNGFSITGDIDITADSLTLTNGTVNGKVTVDGGMFTITAPSGAAAAINGGLEVKEGSCDISGAQIGVKGTLTFGGTDMTIIGTEKAVELNSAVSKTLYGSAVVDGDTSEEAVFADGTYTVGGAAARKLSDKQAGSSEPEPVTPTLTISPETVDVKAGETAAFTVNYDGTDALKAYVQINGLDENFTVTVTDNGNGTYTVTVQIDKETPTGDYTLYVHEVNNAFVQAKATISVTGLYQAEIVGGKKYEYFSWALDNAQTGNTVRLLKDIDGPFNIMKSVTLDLNRHSWNNTATLYQNNTLTLTGSGTVDTVKLGGKLDMLSDEVTVTNLNVTTTPKPTTSLTRGTFGAITITVAGTTAYDLLANGYAFCDNDTGAVQNGKVSSLTNVTVKPHTHDTSGGACACGVTCLHPEWKNGVCTNSSCGERCAHEDINASTYTCNTCGAELAASLTADGSTAYYVGLADALNAAGDAGGGTCTVTLLRDANVTSVDNNGDIANADATIAPGHGSSDRVLDLNGHSITGGGKIDVGRAGYDGHLTVTGSGAVNTEININEGRLTLNAFSGMIDTVTIDSGSISSDEDTNWRIGTLNMDNDNSSGTLRSGTIGAIDAFTGITAADLLAQGYVLQNADGSYVNRTDEIDGLTEVTVVACDHNGTNGFDIGSNACPYCGAPAVVYTQLNSAGNPWRKFANLQTALDSDRVGSSVVRLLADVSGDYTISGTTYTGLALGDDPKANYFINGTVYVTGGGGETTFNGTDCTVETVVASAGAKLAGSEYPAVIKTLRLADGATWENILSAKDIGYKVYTNYPDEYTWYSFDMVPSTSEELHNVSIKRLPITSNTLYLKVNGSDVTKVDRGTTVQLCANCNTSGAKVTFHIKKDNKTTDIPSTDYISNNYVANHTFQEIGEYDIYFTATADNNRYSVESAHKTLSVTDFDLSKTKITFTSGNISAYDPSGTTPVPPYTVTYNGNNLKEGVDYTVVSGDTLNRIGSTSLKIEAVEGSGYTGTKAIRWRVAAHKVKVSVDGDVIKVYDGTTDLPANAKISFESDDTYYRGTNKKLSLTLGTDYTLENAGYDSADASETEKTISFTVKLTNKYTFGSATQETVTLNGADLEDQTFKIEQATIDLSQTEFTQLVFNDLAKTYTTELQTFMDDLLKKQEPAGVTYGDIEYPFGGHVVYFTNSDYFDNENITTVLNGVLSLPIAAANSAKAGDQIGKVTVEVNTTNYKPFELSINIKVGDRITPVPAAGFSASATDLTYGETLSGSTLTVTGTMVCPRTGAEVKGTFAWTDGTITPDAGDYTASWTFTPAEGYEEYASATGTVTVKVNKTDPAFTAPAANTLTYDGSEQPLLTAGTVTGGTMMYRLGDTGEFTASIPAGKDAGTYTVYYKVAGDSNHNDTAEQPITVIIAPKELSLTGVTLEEKTYDGTTDAVITGATFTGLVDGDTLTLGTDYTATGAFTDPNAGDNKTVNAEVTLNNSVKNYTLESGSVAQGGLTIKKASPQPRTGVVCVYNSLAKTYEIDMAAFLPPLPSSYEYGSITYDMPRVYIGNTDYYDGGMTFNNGIMSLPIKANPTDTEGKIGDVAVLVTTTNYNKFVLTVEVRTINQILPEITGGTMSASDITYGQTLADSTLTFTGKMMDISAGTEVTGKPSWTDGTIMPDAGSGEYYWTFTPDASYGGKYATVTTYLVTVNVNKADPTFTAPTANTLTYNGNDQPLLTAGTVTGGTMMYRLGDTGEFTASIPAGKDAGTYTVYYKVAGDSNHNDTAEQPITVTIAPKEISRTTFVKNLSKTYDGTAVFTLSEADKASCLEFYDKGGLETSVPADAYEILDVRALAKNAEGNYVDSPEAGRKTVIQHTVKLTSDNYVLHHPHYNPTDQWTSTDHGSATATITKADAPKVTPGTLNIVNKSIYEYTYDFKTLLPSAPKGEYGDVSYLAEQLSLNAGYDITYGKQVEFENGVLTLPICTAGTEQTGKAGEVKVKVTTDNYEDFSLTLELYAVNRIKLTPGAITCSEITYGDKLSASTVTGTMYAVDDVTGAPIPGTFYWELPDSVPTDGETVVYEFIPDDTRTYDTYTGELNIKVNPVDISNKIVAIAAPVYSYDGQTHTPGIPKLIGAGIGGADLVEGTDYDVIAEPQSAVGSYDLTIRGKGNYTGELSGRWVIDPTPITPEIAVSGTYSYTGEAITPAFTVVYGTENTLLPESEYTVEYSNNTNAGTGTITVTSKGNYTFSPTSTTFTIAKAIATAATEGALNVINDYTADYSMSVNELLPALGEKQSFGSVSYGTPVVDLKEGYTASGAAVEANGTLTLNVAAPAVTTEEPIGTITIHVTTANFEDFDLTVKVSAVNKTVPVPDGEVSASGITYGDALSASTITGKMKDPATGAEIKGTFTWKDSAYKPIAGSNNVEWIFTPDAPEYAAATGKVKVKVDRKSITGAVVTLKNDSVVYDGTEKSPELESVVLDGVTLINGQDYDYVYVYASGTDVGTYGLTVVGYNNYDGEVTVYLSVTPRTVTAPATTVSGAPFIYTGSAFTPAVAVTDDLGHTIDPKEYSVSYKDNTNAGTATITITDNAGGNYIVSGSTTFTIEKAASAITAAPAAKTGLVYNGTEQELITAGTATGGMVKYRLGTTGEFGTALPKAANAGEYTVYYFVEGDANHRDYEVQSLTVTIAKATVTVTATNKSAYVGDPTPDLSKPVEGTDYTISGLFGIDKLTGTVKLAYVDANGNAVTPNMAATGETLIRASGVTAPNGNYTVVFADGKLTVSLRPHYTITATAGAHGSISPAGSVSVIHGGSQSFTITPDAGYAIANVRIDGVSIGAARYYTFENVTSSHTIEAVFMRVNGNPQTGVMVDETDGSYYESAWQGE